MIHEAVKLGLGVWIPVSAHERYDLILDVGTRLLRVQCKFAQQLGAVIEIRCRRCRRGGTGLIHRRYEPGEIDCIAAYCDDTSTCYLLPHHLSVGRAAVQLRLNATKNNQERRIRWASDYEFAATIRRLGPIAQLGERDAGSVEVAGSSPAGSTS